jgi:predicted permease
VGDDALRLTGEFIDQHYFSTLGVAPSRGRFMLPTENRVDGPPVMVISDALWRSTFNADPSVIGRQLGVDLAVFTVIGVAPPGFVGVSGQARFWIPFLSAPSAWDVNYFTDPYRHEFHLIGRLAPGVTAEQAAAHARGLGPRIDARFPERGPRARHWGVAARSLDETRIDDGDRRTLLLLFGAVGMVLLVACANVANLFLVRAASRRREIAVRLAIGASRARIVRQLLVESVLLALAGGAASLVVAAIGTRVISAARPALWSSESASGIGTVFVDPIHLNGSVLMFTGGIAVAVGVLFGLAPALQATRPELTASLKADAGTAIRSAFARRVSMRDALTAFEIALAVTLLAGSGVLVRTLVHLTAIRPGFEPRGVLTMRVNRAAAWSRDSITRFYDVATDRLRSISGVTHVAMADCSPQSGGCSGQEIWLPDHPTGPHGIGAGLHWVTPGWNDVLQVALVRGRSINPADRKGTPGVAVVNQTAAREFWPNDDPIGKRVIVQGKDTVRVIGVVGDVRYFSLQVPPRPDIYISYFQFPMSFRMMLLLRTGGDPASVAEAVRRAMREVAPGFPVYDVATLEARMGGALAHARFLAQLLSLFAALALVLATMGTYGVISYTVAQRTREIGIRIALGATRHDLARLVVGQGVALAAAGGAVGLAGALAGVRVIRTQLYGVEPTDPVTLGGIVVLLALVVLVASWAPARRAAGVPAVEALRAG